MRGLARSYVCSPCHRPDAAPFGRGPSENLSLPALVPVRITLESGATTIGLTVLAPGSMVEALGPGTPAHGVSGVTAMFRSQTPGHVAGSASRSLSIAAWLLRGSRPFGRSRLNPVPLTDVGLRARYAHPSPPSATLRRPR
jgi:hypothetical protein